MILCCSECVALEPGETCDEHQAVVGAPTAGLAYRLDSSQGCQTLSQR
jgi:hypothetical protein